MNYPGDGSHIFFLEYFFRPLKGELFFTKSIYVNMWTTALGFSIIDKLTSVIVNSETASSSLCPHAPTWASELKHFDSQRGFPFSRVTCEMLFCAQEETKPRQNTAESKQNQAPIVFRLLTKYPGVQTFPFKGRKPLEQWGGLWKSQSTEDAFPPRAGKQNFKLIFKKKNKIHKSYHDSLGWQCCSDIFMAQEFLTTSGGH